MAIDDIVQILGIKNPVKGLDSNIPYQDREDYQDENVAMPKVPGKFSIPGFSQDELSSLEYQDRPDYTATPEIFDRTSQLVQGNLMPGESSGIPTKSTKKSEIVSSLSNILSQRAPFANEVEMSEATPYEPKESPLPGYESELDAALNDRAQRMQRAVNSAATTDFLAAANRAMGIKDDRIDTAQAELRRMEDLKLKDLNEKLGLSGKVLGSEKSKMDLQNMGDLNDRNSPISQAYRNGAKELLGNQVSDEVLNQMSGAQINAVLGVDLGTVMDRVENRKVREREFEERMKDRALSREQMYSSREEAKKAKSESKLASDISNWENNLLKAESYKRYQALEPTFMYAEAIKNGEIIPDGVDDASLALQAIKLAQGDASVVRESDQKLFQNVGGLAQDAQVLKQKIVGDAGMTPKVRQAFINIVLNTKKKMAESAKNQTAHTYEKYKKAGVDDDLIPYTLRSINKTPESNNKKISSSYTPEQQAAIDYVVKLKGVSEQTAIDALKKAGRL